MYNSVASWFKGIEPDDADTECVRLEDVDGTTVVTVSKVPTPIPKTANVEATVHGDNDNPEGGNKDIQEQLDELSAIAINSAKEWGSYIYDIGKAATKKVAEKARHLKDSVEAKTLFEDFLPEEAPKQDEMKKLSTASAPWIGYAEEEKVKELILAISKDKTNLLKDPAETENERLVGNVDSFLCAEAALKADPNLQKLRFELVPKQVSEEIFWRNYFHQVALIKQSFQPNLPTSLEGSTVIVGHMPIGRYNLATDIDNDLCRVQYEAKERCDPGSEDGDFEDFEIVNTNGTLNDEEENSVVEKRAAEEFNSCKGSVPYSPLE